MRRHQETTNIFRAVAKKGWTESTSAQTPNAATYLENLAAQIIDDGTTTGDELIDCLVAWYGPNLTKETIDRFDALDAGLAAKVGQTALVVSRRLDYHKKPRKVVTTYSLGVVNNTGLICNLPRGEAYLPTEGHLFIQEGRETRQNNGPAVVTKIFAHFWDDQCRFLGTGSPNLAKQYAVDARLNEAFRPDDYATALDAAESREPHVQVFVGNEVVRDFFISNAAAIERVAATGATKQLASLLEQAGC